MGAFVDLLQNEERARERSEENVMRGSSYYMAEEFESPSGS